MRELIHALVDSPDASLFCVPGPGPGRVPGSSTRPSTRARVLLYTVLLVYCTRNPRLCADGTVPWVLGTVPGTVVLLFNFLRSDRVRIDSTERGSLSKRAGLRCLCMYSYSTTSTVIAVYFNYNLNV